MTSGWICYKNMEKGFVLVLEQDSTTIPPGSVGVVNVITGGLIFYIRAGRPFTHADVTDFLSHLTEVVHNVSPFFVVWDFAVFDRFFWG